MLDAIINRFRRNPVASAGRVLERARARYEAAEQAMSARAARLNQKAIESQERTNRTLDEADVASARARQAARVATRINDFLS